MVDPGLERTSQGAGYSGMNSGRSPRSLPRSHRPRITGADQAVDGDDFAAGGVAPPSAELFRMVPWYWTCRPSEPVGLPFDAADQADGATRCSPGRQRC